MSNGGPGFSCDVIDRIDAALGHFAESGMKSHGRLQARIVDQEAGPLPGFDDIIGLLADPEDSISVGQQYCAPGTGGRERTVSVVVSTPEFVGLCVGGKYELLPVTLFRAMGYRLRPPEAGDKPSEAGESIITG